jgi:hypothetical protein
LAIGGGGGGLGAALGALVDVLGFPLGSSDDVPQAPDDKAMAPVTTRMAARVCRGFAEAVDINFFSNHWNLAVP